MPEAHARETVGQPWRLWTTDSSEAMLRSVRNARAWGYDWDEIAAVVSPGGAAGRRPEQLRARYEKVCPAPKLVPTSRPPLARLLRPARGEESQALERAVEQQRTRMGRSESISSVAASVSTSAEDLADVELEAVAAFLGVLKSVVRQAVREELALASARRPPRLQAVKIPKAGASTP